MCDVIDLDLEAGSIESFARKANQRKPCGKMGGFHPPNGKQCTWSLKLTSENGYSRTCFYGVMSHFLRYLVSRVQAVAFEQDNDSPNFLVVPQNREGEKHEKPLFPEDWGPAFGNADLPQEMVAHSGQAAKHIALTTRPSTATPTKRRCKTLQNTKAMQNPQKPCKHDHIPASPWRILQPLR